MNPFEKQKKGLRPVLIIDHLTKDFGLKPEKGKRQKKEINKNEKVILTLIARVIVEIIIREEL